MNAGRHDAAKHLSLTVVGDAKLSLEALRGALGGYAAPADWTAFAQGERAAWDAWVAGNVAYGNRPASYAQAIGVVNALCHPRDRVVAAAGGLPAEVTANWRTLENRHGRRGVRLFLHGLRDRGRLGRADRAGRARA